MMLERHSSVFASDQKLELEMVWHVAGVEVCKVQEISTCASPQSSAKYFTIPSPWHWSGEYIPPAEAETVEPNHILPPETATYVQVSLPPFPVPLIPAMWSTPCGFTLDQNLCPG